MVKFRTIKNARYLRQEQTKAEKILWEKIRNNGIGLKFRRQHPVDMFIIDFYAPSIKLAIEIDGATHHTDSSKEYDKERTEYLKTKSITVIRFWNSEIEKNLEGVLGKIKRYTTKS